MKIQNQFNYGAGILLLLFLTSCKKQIALQQESSNEPETISITDIPIPSLQNGVLKFSDFLSFRRFKFSNTSGINRLKIESLSKSFISMQVAFDSIVKADAAIGEQLAKQYPTGPAGIFDNTHTNLIKQFPNSIFIEGDHSSGFYYEINTFNRNVASKINKDGFVMVGDWLMQYSKDSIKMWRVGLAGLNGRHSAKTFLSANINDDFSRKTFIQQWEEFHKSSSAKTMMPWPVISSDWRNTSCQNTKRSGGVDKRVIGYINYELYGYPSYSQYETSITNRTISLKGRLFGTWFDSWTTGHGHKYNSQGSTQTVYPIFVQSPPALNPASINWSYIADLAFNNRSENIVQAPTYNAFSSSQWPETVVTIGSKALFTTFNATFYIASGYGTSEDPTCSCGFVRP